MPHLDWKRNARAWRLRIRADSSVNLLIVVRSAIRLEKTTRTLGDSFRKDSAKGLVAGGRAVHDDCADVDAVIQMHG